MGFGLDSLIEVGASTVVLWELSGSGEGRQRRVLCLIGSALVARAIHLLVQSTVALIAGHHASPSAGGIVWTGVDSGIVWTGVTAVVMFTLSAGKARTGRALRHPLLITEGRVTFDDGLLGLLLDLTLGLWWADPVAGYLIAL